VALADYKEKITCTRCGQCRHFVESWLRACPSGTKYFAEPYYSSGRAWIAEAVLDGRVELDQTNQRYIYSCALCRACAEMCPVEYKDYSMEVIQALREESVEAGIVPPNVRNAFKNVVTHGNPFGESAEDRCKWREGSNIPLYEEGQEYLYYVGCVGSYDTRSRQNARALGELLLKAGVSFGVLGNKEICDGNEIRKLGEKGLFESLVEKQAEVFKKLDVEKVVTLSPHSYNAIRNDYPEHGLATDVVHYTQLLRELIENGKVDVSKGFDTRVTYHDPCYLGRWNGVYEAPREVLGSIPGIDLVEMERNRERAYCCGGGGGNFYTDFLSGVGGAACARVKEAYETGAKVLAVACPICTTMLSEAAKTEGIEEELKVMDISEIVVEAL